MRNGLLILMMLACVPRALADGNVAPAPVPSASASPDLSVVPGEWEKTDESDGLAVFRREVPGSSLVEFRGAAIIDASLPKVVGVLLDSRRAIEWVSDLEETRVLRWIKAPFDYIEYDHIGTPFILKDRDFVSRVLVTPDPEKTLVRLDYLPAGDVPEAPKNGCVRGDLTGSGFIAKAVNGGKQTYLDGWIVADPKGSVPKWVVNLFQKGWPRDTFKAIRKQVKKPDVREPEFLKAIFEPHSASL
jgi:hypothetical protein